MRATLFACLLALSACSRKDDPAREQARDLHESPSAKQLAVREAFGSASAPKPNDADADKAELDAFFTKLGADQRASDGPAIVARWDYAKTLDLTEQQGFHLPPNPPKASVAAKLAAAQARQLSSTAKYSAWDQHEITKIVYLDNTRQAVQVYLRQYSQLSGAGRTRWWLQKRDHSWVIYDYEELTAGIRMSTLLGVGAASAQADNPTLGSHGADLMAALQAAAEGRLDDVETSLKRLRTVTFPPALQTYVHYLEGAVHASKQRFDAAISEYDRALKLNPEFRSVELARMTALNFKGDFKAALDAGKKYEDAVGTDADLKHQYARSRRGLKEDGEAEQLLKSCLDEVADHTDCLADLADLLPAARRAELDERLGKLKDFDGSLRTALDLSLEEKRKAGTHALFDATKRVKPASPLVAEYGQRVKAL